MSHTTAIRSVVIVDEAALQRAVAELKSQGIKCDLIANATPRAFYANQDGMGPARYVLQLHEAKYDVGLYQNDAIGGMEARTDLFGGSVENQIGNPAMEGVPREVTAIGKLLQSYAICASENYAAQMGYTAQRHRLSNGTVQLVMNAG